MKHTTVNCRTGVVTSVDASPEFIADAKEREKVDKEINQKHALEISNKGKMEAAKEAFKTLPLPLQVKYAGVFMLASEAGKSGEFEKISEILSEVEKLVAPEETEHLAKIKDALKG